VRRPWGGPWIKANLYPLLFEIVVLCGWLHHPCKNTIHLPVHHYRAEDAVAEAYAMVFWVESGFAQQTEVAHAVARSERTVRRYQQRYSRGGWPHWEEQRVGVVVDAVSAARDSRSRNHDHP